MYISIYIDHKEALEFFFKLKDYILDKRVDRGPKPISGPFQL